MNWIRIAVGMQDDPKMADLAEALKVRLPHAVGLVVCTLIQFPDHAIDGDLSRIPASTLERWAGWHGKAGAYSTAFRAVLCTNGVVAAWEKHNGAPIRRSISNAEYKRQERERRHAVSADVMPDGGTNETRRDETGRDVPAVAVPCDSKKQLRQLPPTRTTRAKGNSTPTPIGAIVGTITSDWDEVMRGLGGRPA